MAALTVFSTGSSAHAIEIYAPIFIYRTNRLGSDLYTVEADVATGSVFYAPDGTAFTRSQYFVSGLTLAEVVDRFASQWTILDGHKLPVGALPQRHYFSLSAGDLQFADFPSYVDVLSPSDGASVFSTFQVSWTGNASIEVLGLPSKSNVNRSSATVTVTPLPAHRTFALRVKRTNWYSPPDVTSEGAAPPNRYGVNLALQSVTERTLHIIPEPSTFALAGASLLALATFRRRK